MFFKKPICSIKTYNYLHKLKFVIQNILSYRFSVQNQVLVLHKTVTDKQYKKLLYTKSNRTKQH